MKNQLLFLISTLFVVFIGCEKDAEISSKEYPVIITLEPSVNSEGVKFGAEITSWGNEDIIEYGFIWNSTNAHFSKKIGDSPERKEFTYAITGGFEKDTEYSVRSYVKTNSKTIYGTELNFDSQGSLSPKITSFNPKHGPIGTVVEIDGANFALSKTANTVTFGDITVTVDSVTENKLFVSIPEKVLKPEKVSITVRTAGMEASSQDFFEIWYPWLQKQDFSLVKYDAASFCINNIGYVINTNSSTMLTYLPDADTWQSDLTLPENSGSTPLAFSYNEKAYVLLKNGFWEYDPNSNNWNLKENFPGKLQTDRMYIFGFSAAGCIYFGNCYKSYEFWEYNIQENRWHQKADFIGNFNETAPVWGNYTFTLNNIGFVGISQSGFALNTLWTYDAANDTWLEKSPLPSDAYGAYCSFVIDEYAYVGLGNNFNWSDGYVSDKIWKYNFKNDKWIEYHNCPVHLGVYASLSLNNKGYIVSGYTRQYKDCHNVWEFDPQKN